MAIQHTIRKAEGGIETIKLTPRTAIVKNCRECMGFATQEVEKCTSPLCPLFPFRLGDSHSGKTLSPEHLAKVKIAFMEHRNNVKNASTGV